MTSFYHVTNEEQNPVLKNTQDVKTGNFLESIKENMKINILSKNEEEIVFDLIGVDASIANALRRILLAEVPTVAIETVWIQNNTGLIQDEVLAHRVGLVPIKVDPRKLDFVQGPDETDFDTLVFHLQCYYPQADENNPERTGTNVAKYDGDVLSKHLEWLPIAGQEEMFDEPVKPVHPDIVLAKLRPGQTVEFEAHCRKGIGKDHTKFSPVATASYRLLPDVSIPETLTGEEAKELKKMCPPDVFDIEDLTGNVVVARARDCNMCRECIRKEGWQEKVKLQRKADHFIFTVESTGSMSPEDIVREAISVLRGKAMKFSNFCDQE